MRCLFKHARFLARLHNGQLIEKRGKPKEPLPENNQPAGTKSYEVYYLDPVTKEKQARVHEYRLPDGRWSKGSLPDPKELRIDGTKYHLTDGIKLVQDPAQLFGFVRLKRCYGRFRKAQCFNYGPIRDRRMGRYTTPLLIVAFFIPLYLPFRLAGYFSPTRKAVTQP